jgi:hypothetical protein
MGKITKFSGLVATFATFSLFGASAHAATTVCPDPTPDTQITLTMDVGSSECYATGDSNPPGGLDAYVAGLTGVTLTAKSDGSGADFFNYITGNGTSGLTGSFTTDGTSQYLLFKTGGGENTPAWFVFKIIGATAATVYSWTISGDAPNNGLSHISAFVPIPAAAWLMGSGLIALFGIGRRRRATAVAA